MSITPISVGGQQYNIDVNMEQGTKTVDESAITSKVSGITAEQLEQVEKSLLKDGIAIKLANGTKVSTEQELEALGRLQQTFDSGDVLVDSMALMKVFQQCQQMIKSSQRLQRAAELTAEVSSLNAAADKMKDAADKRLAAGIVQGVMGIIGGCIQVGAGAIQIGQAAKAFQATNSAQKNQVLANEADSLAKANPGDAKYINSLGDIAKKNVVDQNALATKLNSQSMATNAIGQGLAGISNSIGGVVASAVNHSADMDEVEKTKLEALAKLQEAGYQHANEMMQSAEELIRDMKEKISALQQAQTETNRGMARNI
ncbi:MAG: hypothetical protein H6R18_424 [Proteobacteria bacterium]|nr:hypothetical protein [Pseudomonadota bacterium]